MYYSYPSLFFGEWKTNRGKRNRGKPTTEKGNRGKPTAEKGNRGKPTVEKGNRGKLFGSVHSNAGLEISWNPWTRSESYQWLALVCLNDVDIEGTALSMDNHPCQKPINQVWRIWNEESLEPQWFSTADCSWCLHQEQLAPGATRSWLLQVPPLGATWFW